MDTSKSNNIDELAEMVVMEYSKSYDLDIAMMKAEVSKEDREKLEKNSDFMYMISYQDALIRESIINTMVCSMNSGNPQLKQKAAVDLGGILYKSKFSKKEEAPKTIVPDIINLEGA